MRDSTTSLIHASEDLVQGDEVGESNERFCLCQALMKNRSRSKANRAFDCYI